LLGHRERNDDRIDKIKWVGGKSMRKLADRSFENVAKSRYLGMKVTNQNLINWEIKS
jgi:hypothetical protein